MLKLVAYLCFVISSCAASAFAEVALPIVDLGFAQYQGFFNTSTDISTFLGIPFAEPPLGALRWAAPVPPKPVSGVQLTTHQPNACFQGGEAANPEDPFLPGNTSRKMRRANTAPQSEDCLYLNVYVPGVIPANVTDGLPVMFYMHGGGYVSGSASEFDGTDIVKESNHGLIVVLPQFRLGLFGFLAGTKVKEGGTPNAALLDQQLALQWVHDNIHKFGGDPNKVAIWGESAGAGSVYQHVIAQDGKTDPPLFRVALTSSTFLPSQYEFNDTIPEALYSEVVAQSNCSSAADTLTCLRTVDASVLEAANVDISISGFFGTFVFVPVVDGTFITQRPTLALQQGKINGHHLLSVTNTFEGMSFVNQSTSPDIGQYAVQLFPKLASEPKLVASIVSAYESLGTPVFSASAFNGEAIIICPTYYLLQAFQGSSYKGEFAIPPGEHGVDVGYYNPSASTPSFMNPVFSKAFNSGFLALAMSLNPNAKFEETITPEWPAWNHGNFEMLFNKTDSDVPVVHPSSTSSALLKRCELLRSMGAFLGQ